MTELSIVLSADLGELWDVHMKSDLALMKRSATGAMREVRDIADPLIRANIASQPGFKGKRWTGKALKIIAYPPTPLVSLSPAVSVTHKIPYAGVFEDGETIHGHPYMWIPLSGTPARVGKVGSHRIRPATFEAKTGQKLVAFRGKDGELLLGYRGRVRNKKGVPPRRVTLGQIKRGTEGEGGSVTTIPVFVGIRIARIPKKFNIEGILRGSADQFSTLYQRNMEALDG